MSPLALHSVGCAHAAGVGASLRSARGDGQGQSLREPGTAERWLPERGTACDGIVIDFLLNLILRNLNKRSGRSPDSSVEREGVLGLFNEIVAIDAGGHDRPAAIVRSLASIQTI